jgi:hypothetical protein
MLKHLSDHMIIIKNDTIEALAKVYFTPHPKALPQGEGVNPLLRGV